MVKIKTWCCNLLWVRTGWKIWLCCSGVLLRLAGTILISDFLCKSNIIKQCWPILLPCETGYIVGFPECPHGRSVYALEPFLMEVFYESQIQNSKLFPTCLRGLSNAHWCIASVMKNNVVILLAGLALDWKNPLSKDINGSWLCRKVSWVFLSDDWS